MVLKGVNWVHNDKIGSNGLERSQLGTQWGQMVLKGVTIQKQGDMVLKVVNWVQNDKISSNGLERNQLGTQHKNQVIWS